jgi:hypothetical protein
MSGATPPLTQMQSCQMKQNIYVLCQVEHKGCVCLTPGCWQFAVFSVCPAVQKCFYTFRTSIYPHFYNVKNIPPSLINQA